MIPTCGRASSWRSRSTSRSCWIWWDCFAGSACRRNRTPRKLPRAVLLRHQLPPHERARLDRLKVELHRGHRLADVDAERDAPGVLGDPDAHTAGPLLSRRRPGNLESEAVDSLAADDEGGPAGGTKDDRVLIAA